DALFDKQEHEIPSDIAEILLEMLKLSSALLQKRIKNGYLQLNIPETEYIFNDTGHIIDLQRSKQTESHILIENFMLIANEYIAGQLSDKPTLYRIHEIPDEEKVMNMKDIVEKYELELTTQINFNLSFQKLLEAMPDNSFHRVFDRMILRSMKKAKYSILNQGHFGLAMDTYTHFTSPIRRLCDLIVHHQIKDRINSRSDKFNKPELKTFADIASERELIADESEREVDIKNKLNFMKKKLGEEYEGIIVALRKNAIIVEIDRYPVTGVVPIQSLKDDYYEYNEQYMRFFGRKKGNIYKLTDKVKVLVSLISDDIYFQLIK
ncbi:MAG: RNB domain-containing ribonuclease, partial [Candidatus Cloacimonetes bacterium]|nr:RNB domain-containing ribonuclease [Candidatus Cloacimonadota bacterium]